MSLVAKWHKQYSSLMLGDWVPFPDPGGPALTIFKVYTPLTVFNLLNAYNKF